MTCVLTTTCRIRCAQPSLTPAIGGTAPTRILDVRSPGIRRLAASLTATGDLELLREAHALIRLCIRPVYSMRESRSASRALALGRGSCSQRLAVLEAVARARGIATRTRGLLVSGEFWRPRFGFLSPLLPQRILLAWPQFLVDGTWLDASDLFERVPGTAAFSNDGANTLFDAVGHGTARWSGGVDCTCEALPAHRELGLFDSRDDLFRRYGQNLPCPVRVAVEPLFGRWAAGARMPALG